MLIRRSFWIVLCLLAMSFIAGIYTRSFVYYRLTYLLFLILIVSWLWGFLSIRGLSVNRYNRLVKLQVGSIFEERYELVNLTWYSRLWVQVEDLSKLPMSKGSKVISAVGGNQSRAYVVRTLLQQRGVFRLGPTRIITGDPFGIFQFQSEHPSEKRLMVLPYMAELDEFPSLPGFLPGGRALRRRTLEVSPHAAGVREYAPGDPLSRIHWRSTARRDRLMVKEFEQYPQADVWILLDAHKTSHYRGVSTKPEIVCLMLSEVSMITSIFTSLGRFF